jgi:hypothetical protein
MFSSSELCVVCVLAPALRRKKAARSFRHKVHFLLPLLLLPPRVMSSETPLNFHPPTHQIVVLRSYTAVSTSPLTPVSSFLCISIQSKKKIYITPQPNRNCVCRVNCLLWLLLRLSAFFFLRRTAAQPPATH